MTAKQQIPLVDQWKPTEDDIYFTNAKDIIIAPMASYYHIDDNNSGVCAIRARLSWGIAPARRRHGALSA